ncbi:uncharacterized protein LOC112557356 [Pomacea canaliculata]|uniref:uncharacterized protein LOC112557356 n=1 Tax=Pomacea canaliculata TaxID=400727 RepID=UPI000D72B056|nr:uncharacterized protein LOC112557356 [Pomacea canaliculata]
MDFLPSEEDFSLSSLESSQASSVDLDNDTPLVFLSIGTHGLFNYDTNHVPELSQISLVYQKNEFFRSVSRETKAKDDKELKECLMDLIQWLNEVKKSADGRKAILLAHNGYRSHFKVLCLSLERCGLIEESFDVIGGFSDTLDMAQKFISRERVKNYQLITLAEVFLGCDPPSNARAKARALQKIFEGQLAKDFSEEEVYTFHNFLESNI